jgi:hypothetical protein
MVSGVAPDDVWLGTQHYDGTAFTDHVSELGFVHDVLPTGPGEAWVLGLLAQPDGTISTAGTVVLRTDGTRCNQVGQALDYGFWGGSLLKVNGEVWAQNGALAFRYDGTAWVEVPGARNLGQWQSPEGTTVDDDGVVLHDGFGFRTVPAHTGCQEAFGVSDGEAFCVGEQGQVFHFDGGHWSPAPPDRFGTTLTAGDWGRVPPALWAGGAKLAWGSGPRHVLAVRTTASSDPTAAPTDVLELYDGERWTVLERGQFTDITGSGAGDVWIVGQPLLHHDGASTKVVELPAELGDVLLTAAHSFGPRAAWFVGARASDSASLLLHYDGGWTIEVAESATGEDGVTLLGLGGPSEDALRLLAERSPFAKSAKTGLLYERDEDGAWRSRELWSSFGFHAFDADGERAWITDDLGVHELSSTLLASGSTLSAAPDADIGWNQQRLLPAWEAQLWVGRFDVWLTTPEQAMRRPLQGAALGAR